MPEGDQRAAPLLKEDHPPQVALTEANIESILSLGVRTARSGNKAGARALFSALIRQRPDLVRAWLGMAGVATTLDEQRQALEQVLALDPDNQLARQGLARLYERWQQTEPSPVAVLPTVTLPPPTLEPEPAAIVTEPVVVPMSETVPPAHSAPPGAVVTPPPRLQSRPTWHYGVVAFLLLLLVSAFGVWLAQPRLPVQESRQPTPTLPVQLSPTYAPVPGTSSTNLPSAVAGDSENVSGSNTAVPPIATAGQGATALPSTMPDTAPTVQPKPSASALPAGAVLENDGWRATLLRPDYALVLNGAIGDRQPRGNFVLVLLSVGNLAQVPRFIPLDLFVLVDAQGRSFRPTSGASSTYLAVYGRGQRGDLALEDEIPPGGGMHSVPLLFDVPPDATALRLTMRQQRESGWPVSTTLAQETIPTLAPSVGP